MKKISSLLTVFLICTFIVACAGASETSPASPTSVEKNEPIEQQAAEEPLPMDTEAPAASDGETPSEETANTPPGAENTWLVMFYQNADDEILEEDIFIDLNEAEIIGPSDNVTIVAQMDRFKGGYEGDGNWTSTKRFLLTQDANLDHIQSQEIEDMGELDSGDPQTLVDFATWAIQTYPAQRYVLVISDHGAGWLGGWTDNDPNPDSSFSLTSIHDALQQIIANTNIGQFELFGFDACLMSQAETLSAIAPYAKYAVASEEVEPSLGWAYASMLNALTQDPKISGADLAKAITSAYIVEDIRILDDNARKKLAKDAFEVTDEVSAEEVAQGFVPDITMSAIDLSAISDLNAAINDLAIALQNTKQNQVAKARSYAQSYESVFGEKEPPSYIDLGHFASLLAEKTQDPEVTVAVDNLHNAITKTVLLEIHGDRRPGSTGISIFFPVSKTYEWTSTPDSTPNYTDFAARVSVASLWDDFLRFHYTGEPFDPSNADLTVLLPAEAPVALPAVKTEAPVAAPITPPGSGDFSITPLQVSSDKIKPDEKLTITTEIAGTNIAYIYMYTMFYYEKDDSFLTANIDFVDAGSTKEINGVSYPDWGDDTVLPLDIEWEPTIFYITDGMEENDQFALFEPENYGVKPEDDVYTVNGTLTFQKSGSSRDAIMEFNGNGVMKRVLAFTKQNGGSAPYEVYPKPGDQFTITEKWLEFTNNPEGELVNHDGGTMTFGNKRFEWAPYQAYPGRYIIGIVVEDLNGNTVEAWTDEINITDK